nr:OB-fold nucleic acid binding domain-containing protein [Cyclobacteriaceae bacterium]
FKFEIEAFCNTPCNQLTDLDALLGRDTKICGIVTSVEHRTTKTGRPFGKFTIEDYSGNFTFTLFGEDYLKYKNFMSIGWFLFIEGTIQRNTWGRMDVEFKIRSVELLNELAEKRVQGLALRISVHAVNEEMITALEKLCKENTGGASLQLYLKDEYESLQAEMLSRAYRIKINNPLIAEFRKYAEIGIVSDKGNVRWLTEEQLAERGEEFDEVGTNSPTFVLDTADLIN